MNRCPSCRARIDGADNCRRCGMSLDLLHKIKGAADTELAAALHYLIIGDTGAASECLHRLLALRRDPLAEQLLRFAETEHRHHPVRSPENAGYDALSNASWNIPRWRYRRD